VEGGHWRLVGLADFIAENIRSAMTRVIL